MRIKLVLAYLLIMPFASWSQFKSYLVPEGFEYYRKVTVAIGYINSDTLLDSNKKITITNRFRTLGSGLLTYGKADTAIQDVIITARHVIKAMLERKLTDMYIRFSWADTLRTTDYQGLQVPLFEKDGSPNIFVHPNNDIDLAGIYIPANYWTKYYYEKTKESGHAVFPINNISTPSLGDQVWIYGYPDHIENDFQNKFSYCICTFKPGYITWIPNKELSNPDLNHITLIESNATHGNSGGPVFSVAPEKIILVGILVGGYEEPAQLFLQNNPNPLKDNATGAYYYSLFRSGVSIIEKAENILPLLNLINIELLKRYKKQGWI